MSRFVILGFLSITAMVTNGERRFSPENLKALNQNIISVMNINKFRDRAEFINRRTGLASDAMVKSKPVRKNTPSLFTFSIKQKAFGSETGIYAGQGV